MQTIEVRSGVLLNELYRTTTRLEGADPFDSFLHVAVRDHLRAHHPRVLFIGYGDTDTWQHMGRYDAFLETAHSFDAYLADLWRQLQSTAHYKDQDDAHHLDGSRPRQRTRASGATTASIRRDPTQSGSRSLGRIHRRSASARLRPK